MTAFLTFYETINSEKLKVDEFVKSQKFAKLSFPRMPEFSNYTQLWIPDQACHRLRSGIGNDKTTEIRTFYESIKFWNFESLLIFSLTTKARVPLSCFEFSLIEISVTSKRFFNAAMF